MQLSDIAKRMVRSIAAIALIGVVGSILFHRSWNFLPFAYGIILGSLTSVIKVYLLGRTVNAATNMEKNHAGNYVVLHHLFRLLLSGAALMMGALVPQIELWGVVVGILAFQGASYGANIKVKPGHKVDKKE